MTNKKLEIMNYKTTYFVLQDINGFYLCEEGLTDNVNKAYAYTTLKRAMEVQERNARYFMILERDY